MKGHLLSVDLKACWILIHKDKRIRVRTHSSRLFDAQPILSKNYGIFVVSCRLSKFKVFCGGEEWSKFADVETKKSAVLGVLLQVPARHEIWSRKSTLSKTYMSLKAERFMLLWDWVLDFSDNYFTLCPSDRNVNSRVMLFIIILRYFKTDVGLHICQRCVLLDDATVKVLKV